MKKRFTIENLGCAVCAAKMEAEIKKLQGVEDAAISFMTRRGYFVADDDRVSSIMEEVRKICQKTEPDCRVRD